MSSSTSFPTLFVDLDKVRANIQKMSEKAQRNQLEFRPHFKTHQSRAIGKIFRDFEVDAITVSSIKMARYFAEDGWDDITIAFPANVLAADEYNALTENCELKTLVISKEVVERLDHQLSNKLGLYIEIDPAYGRSGVPATNLETISALKTAIVNARNCYFAGFYCHAGHTYKARSKQEVEKIANKALEQLRTLKSHFPDAAICYGDTPSCSVLENFEGIDQFSPGNFVFYDWMQVEIGSCTPDEIAVYMSCPVIEKFEERQQLLIHGGAVHFSKETIEVNGTMSFGMVKSASLSEEDLVSSISQEHGIITCSKETYVDYKVGDLIEIYPIHSCLTSNLMGKYLSITCEEIDHL